MKSDNGRLQEYVCTSEPTPDFELRFCEVISARIANARSVDIVSAYWQLATVRELLLNVPKTRRAKVKVCLIFDFLLGPVGKAQKTLLEALKSSLTKDGFRRLEICLYARARRLHAKVYRVLGRGEDWFVGSANATEPGFGGNEELCVHIKGPHRGLEAFLDRVYGQTTWLDELEADSRGELDSLDKFLRDARLYFRPVRHLSFLFTAARIPSEILERLVATNQRPPYAGEGQAFGPFSLLRVLTREETAKDEDVGGGKPKFLAPFAIETPLGYWVPSHYISDVDRQAAKSSAKKEASLEGVRKAFQKTGQVGFTMAFKEYLDALEAILRESRIAWRPDRQEWMEKFGSFLGGWFRRIKDPSFSSKYSASLASTVVPDLSEDRVLRDDFVQGFCDYVSFAISKGKVPRVAKRIQLHLGLPRGVTEEDVSERIEAFFKHGGCWNPDWWS